MRTRPDARITGPFGPNGRLLHTLAAAVAGAGLFGGAVSDAHAESSWLKAMGGDWLDAAHWSGGVPNTSADVVFGVMPSGATFEVTSSQAIGVWSLAIRNQSPIIRFSTPGTDDLVVFGPTMIGGPESPLFTVRECRAALLGQQNIGTDEGPGSVLIDGTSAASTGQYFTSAPLRVGDGANGSIVVGANGLLEMSTPSGHPVSSVVGAGADGVGSVTFVGAGSLGTFSGPESVAFGVSGGNGSAVIGPGAGVGISSATVRIGGDGDGSGTGGNGMLLLDHGLIAGNGSLIVGSEGNGTMVSHGGTAQVLMLIGELGGQGSLIVDGTTNLLTVKCAADASDAQLLVTGSGTQCAITNLYLGQHPDGTATMSVDPGATLTSSQLIVSSAGVGELSVEGTCIVNTLLRLRSTSTGFGSSALVDVHGRNALLNAGSIDLGPGSNGHLLVRNGGTVQSIVLTSQTNGTSVVEVGAAGSLAISSAVLSAGTLALAPSGSATITSLAAVGGRVAWTIAPESVGAPAPLTCGTAGFKGPLSVQFADGFEPAAGTDIPLATASTQLVEGASSLEFEPVHGYPPLLVASGPSLSLHVIDHIDRFDLPSSVVLDAPLVALPTIVHVDGLTSDVSRLATWTFSPPGIVERAGPATFVVIAPGTTTGTVHFGQASATVEFIVSPFPPNLVELVSGVWTPSGVVVGNADSYDDSLFPVSLGVGPQSFADGGRLVLFGSKASNLVPADDGGTADVFLKDTWTLGAVRESTGVGNTSTGEAGAITPDGRFVVFSSKAFMTADPPNVSGGKIYLRDHETGTLEYVSIPSDGATATGGSTRPQISANGRYVAFESSLKLVPEDTSTATDVYLRDRSDGSLKRVSTGPNGAQLPGASKLTGFAVEAEEVAYIRASVAGAKLPYVYDIASGNTEMAVPGLTQPIPPIVVTDARLSADGRYLVFLSSGSGVIYDGPLATMAQVYRRDRLLGVTEPVTTNESGAWAIAPIEGMGISDDGRYVAFVTKAPNILPGVTGSDGVSRLYRKDMLTGAIEYCATGQSSGELIPFSSSVMPEIAVSQDGRRIAFATESTNIVPGVPPSTYQIYVANLSVPPLGDLNGDFVVDPTDLALLLGDWAGSHFDLDGDGTVGASDLAMLLGAW